MNIEQQNAERRWFRHDLRVRYQETDQMGVVHHANYLNWFELGRTEMIRELGIPYRTLEERGLLLPVIEAEIKFRSPARYDDRISVFTAIEEFGSLRIHFACEVRRAGAEERFGVRDAVAVSGLSGTRAESSPVRR